MIDIEIFQHEILKKITNLNSFCIAILDIDFFLRYCIRFTEKQCNEIMDRIRAFLMTQVNAGIFLSQKGCDEFCIIWENVDLETGKSHLNHILQQFRKKRFLGFLGNGFDKVRMTFSAGISFCPYAELQEKSMRQAVVALFMAKAMRRNTVLCYEDYGKQPYGEASPVRPQKSTPLFGQYGVAGFVQSKIPACEARLWEPQAMSVDEGGMLYIADQNNHQILRFDGRTVESFFGDGHFGSVLKGENRLNKPTGLMADKEAVYVTDTGNDIVIKISVKTRKARVVCGIGRAGYSGDGGPAGKASFNKPGGIVKDRQGNLYINDIANNVIRKVDKNGIVKTYAGDGAFSYGGDGQKAVDASFNEIYNINIDPEGKMLYLCDYMNNRVRRIDLQSGFVETVAGNGERGYAGNGGGPLDACLDRPVSVCLDSCHNIYIAESGNRCIRVIRARDNRIDTLADGAGSKAFANPNALCVYKNALYVLDGAANQIFRMDIGGIGNE